MEKDRRILAYLKQSIFDFVDEMIEEKSMVDSIEAVDEMLGKLLEGVDECYVPTALYMFVDRTLKEYFYTIWRNTTRYHNEDRRNKEYDEGIAKQKVVRSSTCLNMHEAIGTAFSDYKDVRRQDVLDIEEAWKDDWRMNPEDMYNEWVMPIIMDNDKDLFILADRKAIVSYCQRVVLGKDPYV